MTTISLSSQDVASTGCDALIVAVSSAGGTPHVLGGAAVAGPLAEVLDPQLAALGVTGARDSVTRIPAVDGVAASSVVLTGVGDLDTLDDSPNTDEVLRCAAGAAVRSLTGVSKVAVAFGGAERHVIAAAEGAAFGAYHFTEFKTGKSAEKKPVQEVLVVNTGVDSKAVAAGLERAAILAEAMHGARDLVNIPPSHLFPESFADKAVELGKAAGIKVTIHDDKYLAKNGFGGLTGVGMGSDRGPRLAVLEFAPRGAKKHVALVGKGITFDTGGISLKPPAGMENMKSDMGGAAAVVNTIYAAAKLNLNVKVTAYLCLAENMPSSNAMRPSDVISIYGGKTVEVLNTDAEGRLVMADALALASEQNPDAILDIATLTGAQIVALGKHVSAVMGDDELRETVFASAAAEGEQFWPMPLPTELRPALDSPTADLSNLGSRWGGMLSAGLFLQEFIGPVGGSKAAADAPKIPWAHLDIAGPSYNDEKPHGYTTKGGTGVGVRTLVAVLESYEG